ncbi:MAG: universal stress protein [Pseudolabrys sp.]|nr:universal stress protein [Pseudolabrys sp.]
MHILAATDFSTRSNRALRQAGLLSQPTSGHLHVVHVVDDDQPDDLVRLEKREAERLLSEQIGSMPELRGTHARSLVIEGDPFDGILRTADEIQPDLIVMGSHRKQFLRDIVVGTTIERVVSKSPFPVLMVNFEAQRNYERIIVPTDMSKASANAIRVAMSTGLITDKGATLIHALLAPAKGRMFVAAADQKSVESYVASERQRALDELAAFLITCGLKEAVWSKHVKEGAPMEIISESVSEMQPDLVVMGTNARSTFVKALIGSVTEEALRSLNVDILVVPPSRR